MALPAIGSGIMTTAGPIVPHRMSKELRDLRDDVARALQGAAFMTVVEYTNPAAASTNAILLAKATVTQAVTYSAAAGTLDGAIGGGVIPFGRNITVTVATGTTADAPASLVVTGVGRDGVTVRTETISVPQTATTAAGNKIFYKVTSLAFTAGDGTTTTVAVGFGNLLGLPYVPTARAGIAAPPIIKEIAAGSVVTNGVLSATYNSYAPNTAPNGTNDYAIYYEADATALASQL